MIKFYLESLEDFLSKSSRTSYIRYIVIIIQFSTTRLLLYESMENKELEGSRKQRFTSWRWKEVKVSTRGVINVDENWEIWFEMVDTVRHTVKSCCTNVASWRGYFAHHPPNIRKAPWPRYTYVRNNRTILRSRIIRHRVKTHVSFARIAATKMEGKYAKEKIQFPAFHIHVYAPCLS